MKKATNKTTTSKDKVSYSREEFENDLWKQINKYAAAIGGTVVSRGSGQYAVVIGLNDKVNIQFYD